MLNLKEKFSRRRFLTEIIAPAALAAAYPASVSALVTAKSNKAEFPLHFTDITGLGPEVETDTIFEYFVPLHSEQILPSSRLSSLEKTSVENALRSAFRNDNLPWHDEYEIAFSFQHYGVPHQSRELNELVNYCETSTDYIKSHFSGLFTPNVNWSLLDGGINHNHHGFYGYVGRFTYYVVKAYVSNMEDDGETPYLVQAQPIERAINHIRSGDHHSPDAGTIFLVPGISSMVSPFSEFIHLTFHEGAQRYSKEITPQVGPVQAREQARNVTESLVESLSITMAKQFIHEIGHDEKLQTIQYMADNLATKFTYMPQISKHIQRSGIQNVIDSVQNSPVDFYTLIEQT